MDVVTHSHATKGDSSYYYAHAPRGGAPESDAANEPVARKPLSPASVQALRQREEENAQKAAAAGCHGSAANALNSNQWHWEEKDLTAVVTQRLSAALVGAAAADVAVVVKARGSNANASGNGSCVIESLELSGDMYCNTRKAKRLFGYDLTLTLRWRATASGADDAFAVAGVVRVGNVVGGVELTEGEPATPVVDGADAYEQVSEMKTGALDGCAMDRVLRQRKILHKHMKAKLLPRVLKRVQAVCAALEAEHTAARRDD